MKNYAFESIHVELIITE